MMLLILIRIDIYYFKAKTRKKKELEIKTSADEPTIGTDADTLVNIIEDLRQGKHTDNEPFLRVARIFGDDLTLDNISRNQLVTMCRFMNILPFGGDGMLRVQIRRKVRDLKEDDRMILWEGVDSLTTIG